MHATCLMMDQPRTLNSFVAASILGSCTEEIMYTEQQLLQSRCIHGDRAW
jgi:hypothetical protein